MTTSDQHAGAQPPPASDTRQDHAMGGRAVVTITEQTGTACAFVAHWAIPHYLIPLVAHFLTWTDEGRHRLGAQSWLAHADAFPATLPRQEATGLDAADDTPLGDLDYRYHLYLHTCTRTPTRSCYRSTACLMRHPSCSPGWCSS